MTNPSRWFSACTEMLAMERIPFSVRYDDDCEVIEIDHTYHKQVAMVEDIEGYEVGEAVSDGKRVLVIVFHPDR